MAVLQKLGGTGYKPGAASLTAAYAVDSSTQVAVTAVIACNQSSSVTEKIRLCHSVNAAAAAAADYLWYDVELLPGETKTLGNLTAGDTDVFRVYSLNGNVSFNFYGIENP